MAPWEVASECKRHPVTWRAVSAEPHLKYVVMILSSLLFTPQPDLSPASATPQIRSFAA